ncbi:tRNA (N(6)-L-threonylcarbamoyladenosine(37)-C(2))-methylthiotransferase MtaB [Thermodesulforhabdus norvegica]|uniref:Threonylcarbamoyladenosine tRNA methylthiotransferase MtaB n=1 Tax=Thermodesulforhabdus norvegica TaxID=39841 RepID=A0A1I4U8L1_9BACT|nr:tRNA (N(6)-L-threonylcarbamoyladenosine(37)-C(2))-methylthiotransferase MtaB [Thermodesulforhabdus norvegica]SFM85312.1 threonylcarbamoyladenosine tRNA methylthiotransferase MtaB [Thermodesulforhabdus norvegica]
MKKVAVKTLGCKVNQCESSYLIESLRRSGFEVVDFQEAADIYIVHGCTVTSRAAYETRQFIYRARRTNPRAGAIVLMGCAAHFEGLELARKGLVTHVLGNEEKYEIAEILLGGSTCKEPVVRLSDPRRFSRIVPLSFASMLQDRARAYVKIQDGCDSFCSYCIVPYVRGKSRSLSPEEVCGETEIIREAGFSEIVLTGIHMGSWSWVRDGKPMSLLELLIELEHRGLVRPRVRLSSLEPGECHHRLISYLSTKDWICHHFHVPLQSGDGEILKRMNRHYDPQDYAEVISSIRRHFPHAAIGADVIVGFPGEDEKAWQATYSLIEKLPITYLHVFPYSPRKGTPAARFAGSVEKSIRKARASELRKLGRKKKLSFMEKQKGRYVEVVLEKALSPEEGVWQGTSGNYLTVVTRIPFPAHKGQLVRVRLEEVDGEREILSAGFVEFIE